LPADDPRYWAFLSYSSEDRDWAAWLHRALETYVVPHRLVGRATPTGPAPRRLQPIFRDRAELAADADLAARIYAALDQSAWLIVICSPAAARSHWVDDEIRRFAARRGRGRILSVIVAGEPSAAAHPEDHEQECFPPSLRYSEDAPGTPFEPIAADLRPGGDRRRMARLKLIAGMLGVGLDELVRRDYQRRHRVMLGVSAASLVGMTVMAGLAAMAFVERGAALGARNEAERHQAQAEGLVEYMLADLRSKLEPTGRLDLMDAVGRRALAYYAAQKPGDLDAAALGRRARALQLVGEVAALRGHLGEAEHSFEEASATTAETLARDPNDGQRIFDHAQSVYWVGDIAWERGEIDKADASFQAYRRLAERLVALDPGRDDWRAEVDYAYSNLGGLLLDQGRAAEAAAAFKNALAQTEDLERRHPGDLARERAVGQSRAWLGDAFEQQGLLTEARAQRLAEIGVLQQVLARDPTVQGANFDIVVALRALARLDLTEGDVGAAVKGYAEAARRAEALLATQRDNMDVASAVAIAQIDLAEAQLKAGGVGAANRAQQRASALIDQALRQGGGGDERWLEYRDQARLAQAEIAATGGAHDAALKLDQAALADLAASSGGHAVAARRWLLMRARLQSGDDLAALGRRSEAVRQWSQVLAGSSPAEVHDPKLLVLLQAADARLGHADQARAIGRDLAAMRLATVRLAAADGRR
jgi:tetratricopeptide (TPR) repeat protein